MGSTVDRIVDFICETVSATGAGGVVVGLSGGVDSSVVAALSAKALGPEKVMGVMMTCESRGSDAHLAIELARSIGIEYYSCHLDATFREMLEALGVIEPPTMLRSVRLVLSNIKVRLRMVALYATANAENRLVAGTSNRTELALGYFTKYGDGAADFEPIGGLLKREVYEVARELGVPQEIIDRAPTAGLWPGQTDEGDLGYTYEELDAAVEMIDRRVTTKLSNYPAYEFVEARMKSSEHKRNSSLLGPRPERG